MAETGKKQIKRKERGLNVRVTQAGKANANGGVRVNTYQKRKKTAKKKDEAVEKKIEEKAEEVKVEEIAKKDDEIKAEKKTEEVEKVEKKTEKIKESKKEVEDNKKVEKKVKAEKKTTKAEKKTSEKKENETVKAASFSKDVKKKAKPEIKADAEAEKEEKTEIKEAFKVESKKKKEEPNFAEFETMRIKAPEKAESKIILRDVAKETDISKAPAKVSEAGAKIEHSKEELPKPIKTTTRVSAPAPKLSSKEIKEREIAKAIRQASKMPETSAGRARKRTFFGELGWQRVVLAVGCAATAVFAIAYFVNLTSTDMSIKVAAMQSGIEATYPSYVPRGYTASDVTSSNGKVIINFKNGDDSFGLTEESTTWDSDALLSNYVKQVYGDDYTVVREQGLTLFMGGNWEAWINGGVLYKLTVTHGSLTKKQMKSIAVSL